MAHGVPEAFGPQFHTVSRVDWKEEDMYLFGNEWP